MVQKHYPDQDISLIKITPRPSTDDIEVHEDLAYARWGDRVMQLDLYVPSGQKAPLPVVIFVHGGGWERGSHRNYRPAAIAFTKRGFATATVGISPRGGSNVPGCHLRRESRHPLAPGKRQHISSRSGAIWHHRRFRWRQYRRLNRCYVRRSALRRSCKPSRPIQRNPMRCLNVRPHGVDVVDVVECQTRFTPSKRNSS